MLKISEMAKLANTTRRTLIFYDQEGIFKPEYKTKAGYRYYDYSQLYDLLFILGLKSLDMSLEEVKKIKGQSYEIPTSQLLSTQTKIENKIQELVNIQTVINKKMENQKEDEDFTPYQPAIQTRPNTLFWCSRQSISCTEEEVAQLFSEFYQHLDSLAIMDTTQSGFLTNLSVHKPDEYAEASFRILKEIVTTKKHILTPTIEKKAGLYATILVENNIVGIHQGLTKLKKFCVKNNLKTENNLWQLNANNTLIETGSSQYGWLEFAII